MFTWRCPFLFNLFNSPTAAFCLYFFFFLLSNSFIDASLVVIVVVSHARIHRRMHGASHRKKSLNEEGRLSLLVLSICSVGTTAGLTERERGREEENDQRGHSSAVVLVFLVGHIAETVSALLQGCRCICVHERSAALHCDAAACVCGSGQGDVPFPDQGNPSAVARGCRGQGLSCCCAGVVRGLCECVNDHECCGGVGGALMRELYRSACVRRNAVVRVANGGANAEHGEAEVLGQRGGFQRQGGSITGI